MDTDLRQLERQWMASPSTENLNQWNAGRVRAGLEPVIEQVIAGLADVTRDGVRTTLFTIGPFWYVAWQENGIYHRSPPTDEVTARTIFSLIKDLLKLVCSACDNRGTFIHPSERRLVSCPCTLRSDL